MTVIEVPRQTDDMVLHRSMPPHDSLYDFTPDDKQQNLELGHQVRGDIQQALGHISFKDWFAVADVQAVAQEAVTNALQYSERCEKVILGWTLDDQQRGNLLLGVGDHNPNLVPAAHYNQAADKLDVAKDERGYGLAVAELFTSDRAYYPTYYGKMLLFWFNLPT
ncbi:MAG: hypothetical protein ACREGA_01085 [Candidatus Saccharimonadales bacterium]